MSKIPTPASLLKRLAERASEGAIARPCEVYLAEFERAVAEADSLRVRVYDERNIERGADTERSRQATAEYAGAVIAIEQTGWRKIGSEPTGIRDGSKYDIWVPKDSDEAEMAERVEANEASLRDGGPVCM